MSFTPVVAPAPTGVTATAVPIVSETILQEIVKDVEVAKTKVGLFLTPTHIILTALLALSLFAGTYMFASRRASQANAKVTAAVATAQQAQRSADAAVKQNAAFQAQTNQELAQLETVNTQLLAANKKLISAISASNAALALQKKTDAAMTPTQQSTRWQELVPGATVAPTAAGFAVDNNGGLLTIQDLETLPILTAQVAELQTEVSNDTKVIANSAAELTAEKAAHASDLQAGATQLAAAHADTTEVQAKLNAQKKATMRTRLRWFGAGFISGWIVGVLK